MIMNPTRLPRLALIVLCAALITAPLAADDMVLLDLRFARINLANGRTLNDAALTGFNRDSDLIYVMEDRQLKPYPAALFPGFVIDQIAVRLAEYPDSSGDPPEPAPTAPAAPSPPPERDPIGSPADNAARAAAIEDAIATKARTAALRHFRYAPRMGSGYATMTTGDVDLDQPTAVRGWPHRYRVEGTVYLSFYDSVGSTFQNRRRGVEVIVEAPNPREVRVLEVNTDWTPNR